MLFCGFSYREISGTKNVELRYIQATDTKTTLQQHIKVKIWQKFFTFQELKIQVQPFFLFFVATELWNFTEKCRPIFGV